MSAFQAVKGMNDQLPKDTPVWQYLEACLRNLVASYGYQEIRTPILENTELFSRSIGEITDIVEKEMYSFVDKGGDQLTLRPEGTAACVRAGVQHGLLYNQQQRLWYLGPLFRRERPQKGRYRQFHQFGAETFGIAGPDIDAELVAMSARLWKILGLSDAVVLEINSLASNQSREAYKKVLVEYFSDHLNDLDEDSQRRLKTNPLRILDSKNPGLKLLIDAAPKLNDFYDADSRQHFAEFCNRLDVLGIAYQVNPKLVRGLDYYNRTVFEWKTTQLGAQGTICAGGRYDGLVKQLGGQDTPACGFAIGMERVVLMLSEQAQLNSKLLQVPAVYLCVIGLQAEKQGAKILEELRDELPDTRFMLDCGGGNLKKQLKRADKSGAGVALILGDEEMQDNSLKIKFLRDEQPQINIARQQLADKLKDLCI